MRRGDKEITDLSAMEKVISQAQVCRVAFSDGKQPYVVPLCFGYTSGFFYFHSANLGLKIAFIQKNPLVCLELEIGLELVPAKEPCDWGMRFQSIIAMGTARLVTDLETKRQALDLIMSRYTDTWGNYPENALKKTAIIEMKITQMTGKQSGQPGVPE